MEASLSVRTEHRAHALPLGLIADRAYVLGPAVHLHGAQGEFQRELGAVLSAAGELHRLAHDRRQPERPIARLSLAAGRDCWIFQAAGRIRNSDGVAAAGRLDAHRQKAGIGSGFFPGRKDTWDQSLQGLIENLPGIVAEDLLSRRVEQIDAAFSIGHHDGVEASLGKLAIPRSDSESARFLNSIS